MQFTTNAKDHSSADAIIARVKNVFPNAKLDLELESADKVLHVHGIPEDEPHASRVISAIEEAGFTGSRWIRGEVNK